MARRVAIVFIAFVVSVSLAGAAAWWWTSPDATDDEETLVELPTPPFPPRITEGEQYESCLATLADDPAGAESLAESWQASGGGDGAAHCHGLAMIALGEPDQGAAVLERLAQHSNAPALARASVMSQAVQARLMVGQATEARADASAALDLSPDDTELFIMRASAEGLLGAYQDAVQDLNNALQHDAGRTDALVARAVLRRNMGQLDLAQADVGQALTLDPDDADALLERGILRERMGDRAGARADWEHARGVDPDSVTADLAEQNLSLLEAGPRRQ
jgi:tetratricopeptide (TPR) repeat protein